MKTLQIIAYVLLLTVSSYAQTINNQKHIDFIEVTGVAEKEVVPNEIHIEILIKERIERGKKVTIKEQENDLKKELKTIGVPIENLSISDLNANIAKIGWWREKVLASANYNLKLSDVSKLKEVFNFFEELEITEAHITKATHSKIRELKKQNRIDAIKAAKEKSDYLLNAIGQKTGKPIEIREINSNFQPFAVANYQNNSFLKQEVLSKSRNIDQGTIQFQKIKLTTSMYVKFRIQ